MKQHKNAHIICYIDSATWVATTRTVIWTFYAFT